MIEATIDTGGNGGIGITNPSSKLEVHSATGLINLKTNLKSLKYGKDRPGGGSSNQPYIRKEIPEGEYYGDFPIGDRGILAPIAGVEDASRLSKMLFDTNGSKGFLFIGKQNVLSRMSVKTEATKGIGYAGGLVNQGVYLPSSTIAQAAVMGTGTHLNLLGLNPFSPGLNNDSLDSQKANAGLIKYEQAAKDANKASNNVFYAAAKTLSEEVPRSPWMDYPPFIEETLSQDWPNQSFEIIETTIPEVKGEFENRLLKIWYDKQNQKSNNDILTPYSGGPGSVLGIGKTHIRFADQRTGVNNPELKNSEFLTEGFSVFTRPPKNKTESEWKNNIPLGVSYKYNKKHGELIEIGEGLITNHSYEFDGKENETNPQNVSTFSEEQLIKQEKNLTHKVKEDFRKVLIPSGSDVTSKVLSISPSYIKRNIENRVGLGDPGKYNKNVLHYPTSKEILDKITALEMYEDTSPAGNKDINDLVKFRIEAINNDGSGKAVYMHFRAFIDLFSDNYSADWKSVDYVGRGESFHNYSKFERKINLGFTVVAQSKAELIPMYRKLNYLASTLAPDYGLNGLMKGNLVRLTLGGYLYEQPGFITSLTYDIPESSTWEIGIDDTDGENGKGWDNSVKELPHMIKVTGFSFTPIHTFLPSKASVFKSGKVPKQRFIALSKGGVTNY